MTRPHEDVIREALRHGRPVGMGSNDQALDALAALVDERNRFSEWFEETSRLLEQTEDERNRLREALTKIRKRTVNLESFRGYDDGVIEEFARGMSEAYDDCRGIAAAVLAASPGDKAPEASGPPDRRQGR